MGLKGTKLWIFCKKFARWSYIQLSLESASISTPSLNYISETEWDERLLYIDMLLNTYNCKTQLFVSQMEVQWKRQTLQVFLNVFDFNFDGQKYGLGMKIENCVLQWKWKYLENLDFKHLASYSVNSFHFIPFCFAYNFVINCGKI